MHHPLLLRGPLRSRQLTHRVGTNRGTQHNTTLRITASALDAGQNTRSRNRAMFNRKSIQLLRYKSHSRLLGERRLGVAMQMTTKIYCIHRLLFYFFTILRGRQRKAIFFKRAVYWGVVPQQPPTILSSEARHICSISLAKWLAATAGWPAAG